MPDPSDRMLAVLDRLEGKVDNVRDDVAAIRSQHGQRLATVEAQQVALPDCIRADIWTLISEDRAAWQAAISEERQAWQAALAEERNAWSERVNALESDRDRLRGAAVLAGAFWSVIVSVPGFVALWLGLSDPSSGSP